MWTTLMLTTLATVHITTGTDMWSSMILTTLATVHITTGTDVNNIHNITSYHSLPSPLPTNISSDDVSVTSSDIDEETPRNNSNITNSLNDTPEILDNVLLAKYGLPTVWGVIFVIGVIGNGILLIIFILNSNMRTRPNIYLFNLVISDILALLLSLPLNYVDFLSTEWTLGLYMCKIFWLLRDLTIGASVFSVTMLSIQRYFATVMVLKRNRFCFLSERTVTFLHILTIWVLAFCSALPLAIAAYVPNICSILNDGFRENYLRNVVTFHFFAFCLIPLIIIAFCHTSAARYIRTSAKHMPGEQMQQHAALQKDARFKSARIILGLTVVFFISYVPNYVWLLIFLWGKLDYTHQAYIYLDFITYSLLFTNSCLNPIALYCSSNIFRKYFNQYLSCFRSKS